VGIWLGGKKYQPVTQMENLAEGRQGTFEAGGKTENMWKRRVTSAGRRRMERISDLLV